MEKDKSQLENKINKTATELFSLKKSNNFDDVEYKSLFTKISDLIWRWAKIVFGQQIANSSVEIMQCIKRSLDSFTITENGYMKYISASLKKEINNANKKNQVYENKLISISENQQRTIKNILKYAEVCGYNINSENDLKHIAIKFNINYFDIKKLVVHNYQSVVLSDYTKSSEDEDYSLIESCVSHQNFLFNPEKVFLDKEINNESYKKIKEVIFCIEEIYIQEKEKTENQIKSKTYLSALITRQVIEELSSSQILTDDEVKNLLLKTSFVDKTVLGLFIQGNFPNQQDIAKFYGKDKTDASRKVKSFLKKLQEKLSTREIINPSYISGGKE